MKRKRNVNLILILLLNALISRSQQIYFPPLNSAEWETIPPKSLGWCTDKIDSLYSFLEHNNTKSFMVLKDGRIILEKYFGTFTSDSLWYWASAGKTLTGMLAGIAQQEGFLSIDHPVSTYLGKGWSSCSAEKENLIRIRNQLTMTSGLNDLAGDPDCTTPSCLLYLADAGTRWAYHNAPYTILDQVISSATGINFNTYFTSRIRNKIGMNGLWVKLGYNNVYFSSTRSMARYGLLLLAKGKWENQPVINDTAYFRQMTNSSQNLNKSYGYLTWLNGKSSYMLPQTQRVFSGPLCPDAPAKMYAAMGKNGQLINVVPDQNLVVIRMGNAPDNQLEIPNVFNNLIWQHLNRVICNATGNSHIDQNKEYDLVFPNPASTFIHIETKNPSVDYRVRFFDSSGQLKAGGLNIKKLDVSGFSEGLYLLVIIQKGVITRHMVSLIH